MFCSNCGSEVSGKFCSNCGTKVLEVTLIEKEANIVEPIQEDTVIDNTIIVNGVVVDMGNIINTYGDKKIAAIKYLRGVTGVSLSEGKDIVDKAYNELYKSEPKKGFWESVKVQADLQRQREQERITQEKERVRKLDEEGIAYCPKCKSTSLSAQKKGFGIGKAVIGAKLTGGIGLVAGNLGAKKVRVTCLKCGHQFWAGK